MNNKEHCFDMKNIESQFEASRKNLGLNTIDLLYLHNPYEMQGSENSQSEFFTKLAKVFEYFETLVQRNYIKNYGLSTFVCFRVPKSDKQNHLNLQNIVQIAEKVAGKNNHFKYIQAPINVAMPELMTEQNQELKNQGKTTEHVFLAAANRLQMNLISCEPLFQGNVTKLKLLTNIKIGDRGAKHLQLIRSIPAVCLKSTVVGMKTMAHLKANLEVAKNEPLKSKEFSEAIQSLTF